MADDSVEMPSCMYRDHLQHRHMRVFKGHVLSTCLALVSVITVLASVIEHYSASYHQVLYAGHVYCTSDCGVVYTNATEHTH
eukprot:5449-Heterococcus_DN1.PRE.4